MTLAEAVEQSRHDETIGRKAYYGGIPGVKKYRVSVNRDGRGRFIHPPGLMKVSLDDLTAINWEIIR